MFGVDTKKKVQDDVIDDDPENLLENKSLSAESNSLSSEDHEHKDPN